jgi:hypothetical protein
VKRVVVFTRIDAQFHGNVGGITGGKTPTVPGQIAIHAGSILTFVNPFLSRFQVGVSGKAQKTGFQVELEKNQNIMYVEIINPLIIGLNFK